MRHPAFHGRIMGTDRAVVAELAVQHIRHIEEGRRPGHVIGIDRPVIRGDIRDASFRAHGVLDILQPFVIQLGIIENKGFAVSACRTVAQPAETFVTLRAVGRHPAIITTDSPIRVLMDLVDQRVGCFKTPGCRHLVINDMSGKRGQFRFIIESRNFHKTETMINETGLPTEITVFSRSINVGHLRSTQIGQIERAVFLQQFGKLHRYGFTFLSFQVNREPTDHVLPHVQDILSIGTIKNGYRLQRFLYADIRVLLCCQFARRSLHHIGSFPCAVVETVRVPTFHLEAGIIFFAIKLVICDDRSFRGDFPRRITDDRRLRPVCIFDPKLRKQTRQAECFHSRITHREETAVPQNHSQCILVGSHQSCHIIYIIIYTFIIQGRHRGKHVLADFLSVQVSLIRAKTGNIQDGSFHRPIRRKLFTQISGGQACFIVSTGHTYLLTRIGEGIFADPGRFPFRIIEQGH